MKKILTVIIFLLFFTPQVFAIEEQITLEENPDGDFIENITGQTKEEFEQDIKKEKDVHPASEKNMFRLIKAAFGQRRKTFVNSVSANLSLPKAQVESALSATGLDLMVRPEKLTLKEFAALSDILLTD